MNFPIIANVHDAESLEIAVKARAATDCRSRGDLFCNAIVAVRDSIARADSICRYCVGTDNLHYLSCPIWR